MKIKRLLAGAMSAFALLGVVVMLGGSTASAVAPPPPHRRFQATGYETSFTSNIGNPPQVGQYFILEENLKNASGAKIGTDHIECTVVGFTATALKFDCKATYYLSQGSVKATVQFDAPFSPAAYPIHYDGSIFGGSGIYTRADGVVHVTDNGPHNPTGYDFDFVIL